MPTKTLTVVDFLLARLSEDEAKAQAVLDHEGSLREINERIRFSYRWAMLYGGSHSFHIGAPSPARVLADVAAKRRIVEAFTEERWRIGDLTPRRAVTTFEGRAVLTLLAQPYSDHPDFNEEWRDEWCLHGHRMADCPEGCPSDPEWCA